MNLKRFSLILSIFSFLPMLTLAQGYIPDPDIQMEEFKEIDRQRAEEERLNNQEDSESDEATKKKPGRIRSIYDEYMRKSDQVNGEQPIKGAQLLADFITDKFPLTLDLGAEPGEHGSTLFGVLQYDWNKKSASRIRLEYKSIKDSRDPANWFTTSDDSYDSLEWLSITKEKGIEIDLYPYIRYFGDESMDAYSPFFCIGFGAFYSYSWYDITASYWIEQGTERWMIKADEDRSYHQFGPLFIASVKFPFLTYFGAAIQLDASPINRLKSYSDTHASYFSNTETYEESGSSDNSFWCSPTLKLDVALDFLTYFRIRTKIGYSKIYYSLSDVNQNSTGDDENKQETYALRYGAEIVFPSSNRTRKKNSHLWAGLYYEHTWEVTTENSKSNTNHTGKWIFCFGT